MLAGPLLTAALLDITELLTTEEETLELLTTEELITEEDTAELLTTEELLATSEEATTELLATSEEASTAELSTTTIVELASTDSLELLGTTTAELELFTRLACDEALELTPSAEPWLTATLDAATEVFVDDLAEDTVITDDLLVTVIGCELLPPPHALSTTVSDKADKARSEYMLKFSIFYLAVLSPCTRGRRSLIIVSLKTRFVNGFVTLFCKAFVA